MARTPGGPHGSGHRHPFTPRFSANATGDTAIIGNTLETASTVSFHGHLRSPNRLAPATVSGTVFEDVNYGGPGRSLAASQFDLATLPCSQTASCLKPWFDTSLPDC